MNNARVVIPSDSLKDWKDQTAGAAPCELFGGDLDG